MTDHSKTEERERWHPEWPAGEAGVDYHTVKVMAGGRRVFEGVVCGDTPLERRQVATTLTAARDMQDALAAILEYDGPAPHPMADRGVVQQASRAMARAHGVVSMDVGDTPGPRFVYPPAPERWRRWLVEPAEYPPFPDDRDARPGAGGFVRDLRNSDRAIKTQDDARVLYEATLWALVEELARIDRQTPADPQHPDRVPRWWSRMVALRRRVLWLLGAPGAEDPDFQEVGE